MGICRQCRLAGTARRDVCLARPARRREHDPTFLLFSLTCSIAYSVLARPCPAMWPDRTVILVISISKFASPPAGQRVASKWGARRAQATAAGRALVAVREMADVVGFIIWMVCNPGPLPNSWGTCGRLIAGPQPGGCGPGRPPARRFVTDKLVGR